MVANRRAGNSSGGHFPAGGSTQSPCSGPKKAERRRGRIKPAISSDGGVSSHRGGIYLSLEMVTAFLKINVPEEKVIWGVSLDPLALVAIVLAAA